MADLFAEEDIRRQALIDLRRQGINPYPAKTERTHGIDIVLSQFATLSEEKKKVTLAGRVMALRQHGGATFAVLFDGTASMQIYIKKDEVGEESYALLESINIGDFVEASGILFQTHRGERTLLVDNYQMIAKTLRSLPEKWHGLQDVEQRYRKRYLDLLVNESVFANAKKRSAMMTSLRQYLDGAGYIEVDTPVLQTLAGGATARPFVTHLNAIDIDLYLRVAPELYLKRLLVAGFPKIYEIARCFRNEGMDHAHNPEFTQIELYLAYADYRQLMGVVEEMLTHVIFATLGSLELTIDGRVIDFSAPYKVQDWVEALDNAIGYPVENLTDDEMREKFTESGVELLPSEGRGAMYDAAYKKFVRPHIVEPTFLIDHPICLSPLAKRHVDRPNRAQRFHLVVGGGVELVNGFSELNDPIDQRERFMEQEHLRAVGDDEAQRLDEDFLEALEHGMPPTAGLGMGLDRLAALLTGNHSLKEVILFPTLRPKKENDQ